LVAISYLSIVTFFRDCLSITRKEYIHLLHLSITLEKNNHMSVTKRYSATALFSFSLSALPVEETKIKRGTCPIARHGEKLKNNA
jgi:hypothetical protein